MLKIGDFSKLSRISVRMLRHYDEQNLLKPKEIDKYTGYRYYAPSQLTQAARINMLREMSFGVGAIKQIIEAYNCPDKLNRFLQIKQEELNESLQQTKNRIQLINTAIKQLERNEKIMQYNVIVKEIPKRYVASVRQILPQYDKEGVLWGLLGEETAKMNLKVAQQCDSLAVFHDKEHKEKDVDVEIQITVEGEYTDTPNVKFKTVDSVLVAAAVFEGDYSQFSAVNEAIVSWIEENDYMFAGPSFSIYHVSPATAKSSDDLVTEFCFPIKKKTES